MCGITGILNFDGEPVNQKTLQMMMDTIAHRGPDGEGVYIDGSLGLGHRRLAIIDLTSEASQPMSSECNNFHLTYNGELYNYKDLRDELEKLGVSFKTKSDTEVVLKALIQWNTKALSKFNGMFALALWNVRAQELLIARDRYGVKPLYYSKFTKSFVFGSECKSIISNSSYNQSIDVHGLVEYLTFQNIISNRTIFSDITLLPQGSYLKVSKSGKVSPIIKYWEFEFSEPTKELKKEVYIDKCQQLLKRAVNKQMAADVEIGSYLSGGMDTGSITSIATANVPAMKTFTIGFDTHDVPTEQKGFDERLLAERLSKKLGTEHYEMVLKSSDMQRCLNKLAWHLEEPRVGQSYPNYYAAKLASKFVKVVLSGTGGDELFAGYPWRYSCLMGSKTQEDKIEEYFNVWRRLFSISEISEIMPEFSSEIKQIDPREIFLSTLIPKGVSTKRADSVDLVNLALTFEAKTFLQGLLLVEDKISMSHSLESRVPFLDNDLVDFAMSLPLKHKLNLEERCLQKSGNTDTSGKKILREACKGLVGKEISNAKKQGFAAPDYNWLISYTQSRQKPFSKLPNFFNQKKINQLLTNQNRQGQFNPKLRSTTWSFISLTGCYSAHFTKTS